MTEDKIDAAQAESVEAGMAATDFADELSDEALDRGDRGVALEAGCVNVGCLASR